MLFGKNLSDNFYNYCPCLRLEGDRLHVWYCANKDSGNITDYIGYRTGEKADGNWVFSEETLVLGPTKGSWDQRHTCDPSVTKGVFHYQNETYHYLMFYLGCVTEDCTDNETGIAVAKTIDGPWIKYDKNPLIPFIGSRDYVGPHTHWGYGQPCVVSVDKRGRCLIFYNVGIHETFTRAEHWDLSNLDEPQKLDSVRIRDHGYLNISGVQDVIGNADFAYDMDHHVMYATGDMRVRGTDQPTYISNALPILKTPLGEQGAFPMSGLFDKAYTWEVLGVVDESVSGYPKNHNPGLLADLYGHLHHPDQLFVGYTVSALNKQHPDRDGIWQSLHSYRIYGHRLNLSAGDKP
ncbi:MAG: hypothetical protein WC399_03835 [Bacilli bacterium]